MKKNYFWSMMAIMMAALLSVGFTSCSGDDPDPELTVDATNLKTFTADGGDAQYIEVKAAHTGWTVEVVEGEEWIRARKDGTNSIKVTVSKNNEESSRNGAIKIICEEDDNLSREYTIRQEGVVIDLEIFGLDSSFPAEAGNLQNSQTLTINCNSSWQIIEKPSWISIESTSGNGNQTVRVWTNTDNNSSSRLEGTITVKSGSKSKSKIITQEAGINSKLFVSPKEIVVLANGIACDWNYGSEVMYYYARLYLPSSVDRKIDSEIIEEMSEDPDNRDTPGDSYVTSWRNLSPLTDYVLCTVGFDKNGKAGSLVKTTVRTKNNVNQAASYIDNVTYDSNYWYWTTTTNGFVTKYYMWFVPYTSLYNSTDAAVAWFFKQEMRNNPDDPDFAPIAKDDSWQRPRNGGTIFHVVTWAVNVENEFSGVIDRFAGSINSSTLKKINDKHQDSPFKRYKTYKKTSSKH